MASYLSVSAAAAAKSLQSCSTLCDPIDSSPLDSSVPGILQARTLEWVAISFSNAWKWKVKVKLLILPGSTVHGFSRQEYWSGLPFLSLANLYSGFMISSNVTTSGFPPGLLPPNVSWYILWISIKCFIIYIIVLSVLFLLKMVSKLNTFSDPIKLDRGHSFFHLHT